MITDAIFGENQDLEEHLSPSKLRSCGVFKILFMKPGSTSRLGNPFSHSHLVLCCKGAYEHGSACISSETHFHVFQLAQMVDAEESDGEIMALPWI